MFITAFEFLDHEISKHEIFYDKNIDILIKPVKLRQIEDSLLSLVHNETFLNCQNIYFDYLILSRLFSEYLNAIYQQLFRRDIF